MRVLKRNPWLTGLGTVLSLLGLWWGSAQADATTDQTASVLIFPKVIADGTRDTLIQITNTSPMEVQLHCEYINGTGRCAVSNAICVLNSDCNVAEACVNTPGVTCQTGDFNIALTRFQPTIWRVSTGRQLLLSQMTIPGECNPPGDVCPGFDAGGTVPPPPGGTDGFRGALVCFEIDESDFPIGQNAVKGEATIQTLGTSQISEHNGIGLRFRDPVGVNDIAIQLDNLEYDACPASLIMNHYSEGADDLVAEGNATACPAAGDCPVSTELSITPCSLDFLNESLPTVTVNFSITNEFEQTISAGTTFSCWFNGTLEQISSTQFSAATLGTSLAKTRMRPAEGRCVGGVRDGLGCSSDTGQFGCEGDGGLIADGQCRPQSGIVAVAEAFHSSLAATVGVDAENLHFVGSRAVCSISGNDCSVNGDADCTGGLDRCATDVICRTTDDPNAVCPTP